MKRLRDRIRGGVQPDGIIRGYERRVGEILWRPAFEAENVILDQWYVTLLNQLGPDPLDSRDIGMNNLALGYGISPTPDITDVTLDFEWTDAAATLTAPTVVTPTTSLAVTALPYKIAAGETIKVGPIDVPILSADANPGDVTIAVTSYTPSAVYPVGTRVIYINLAVYIPQRLPAVVNTVDSTSPPSTVISFFLMAASNSEPITFTEAGLIYATNTAFASHVAFAYTKSGNTDLRVDYTLARESDE
jgi:hypothetical protein